MFNSLLKGNLFGRILVDDSVWTLGMLTHELYLHGIFNIQPPSVAMSHD